MVLQRDIPIKIWGWADKKDKLTIVFQGDTVYTTADKKGNWQVALPSYPAGGPFELAIFGKQSLTFSNVLLGDVWICSGQSNMEWPLKASNNAAEEIGSATYPRIRLLTVDKNTSATPRSDMASSGWTVCSPHTISDFSAVAYFLAEKYMKILMCP